MASGLLGMLGKAGNYIKNNPGEMAGSLAGGFALGSIAQLPWGQISNELQDPRFYSNVGGMLTGKSKEERAAAHKNMDPNEFKDVYGDEILNKNEHKIIWNTLVGKAEGPDYKRFFHANVEDKAKILSSRAKDVDDALWRSREWMKISGDPSANERMSLLDYGKRDQFGHGTTQGERY